MSKFSLVRLAVAALCAVSLSACAALTGTGDPNVAATVNGTDVLVTEVEERYEQAKKQPQVAQQLESDADGAVQQQIQAQILSQLVSTQLLDQWAEELGVEATDEDVAEEREKLIEQLGGQEAFDSAVEQSGLSDDEVEAQIRQSVLSENLADVVAKDVEVSDEDIEAFYEENAATRFGGKATARHILVKNKAKANAIFKDIRGGADFAKLAKKESTDPGSAEQGGELPEFGQGQMVPEFEEAVFSAEEGELVGPVKTDFGYHVIEVLSLSEGQSLDEVREEIRDELAAGKEKEVLDAALKERTEEAEVTVNPRFGTWNEKTGQVEPEKPLGATTEAPGAGSTEMPPMGNPSEMPPIEMTTE